MNDTYEESYPPPEPNGIINVAGSSYLAVVNHDVGVDIVAVDTGLPVQLLGVNGAREAVWSGNSSHLAVLSVSSLSQCCNILVYVCTETVAVSLSHPQWTLIKTIPAPTYSEDHMSRYQYSHLSFSYPLASLTVFQSPHNTDIKSRLRSDESNKQHKQHQGLKRNQQKQQPWSVYDSIFVYNAALQKEEDHHRHHQHHEQKQQHHLSCYRLSRVVLLDVLVGQFDELQLQPPSLPTSSPSSSPSPSPPSHAITATTAGAVNTMSSSITHNTNTNQSAPPTPGSSSSSSSAANGSSSSSGGLDGPSLHSVASLNHLVVESSSSSSSTDHQHHDHDHHHHIDQQRMWVMPLCAPRLSR